MSDKPMVLFLCTGNSCRSQMAEGLFRFLDQDNKFSVNSAGLTPDAAIHPLAIEVMQEINIDIPSQYPKSVSEFLGKSHINYLITVCENADKNCPHAWPGLKQQKHEHWSITDPSISELPNEQKIELFREARNLLKLKIKNWITKF